MAQPEPGTSTPLSQLRAKLEAPASQPDIADIIDQHIASHAAQAAPAPAPPPAVALCPAAAPAALLAPTAATALLAQPAAGWSATAAAFLRSAAFRLGVAVAVLFVLAGLLPVDGLVEKYGALKRLPAAATLLRALATGAAASAVALQLGTQ
jgi:hypothetical protein